MGTTAFTIGIACVVAAAVGGGFKATGHEFPVIKSIRRQLVLGVIGFMLMSLGVSMEQDANSATPLVATATSSPMATATSTGIVAQPTAGLLGNGPLLSGGLSPGSAPLPTMPPVTASGFTPAERELLTHVPASIASSCVADFDTDPDALAGLMCQLSPDEAAVFLRYNTGPGLDTAYFQLLDLTTLTFDSGNCFDHIEGESTYTVSGATAGRVGCVQETDGALLFWSITRLSILGILWGPDGDDLFDWWNTNGNLR